ncbi:PREDICTED: neurotensin receptor type 2 isoform X4 [Cercocebus atys]|uniref:neurotensin receptor type 2 isoform X4 n=1 Tax=Cercocebus atys TaxID=9531 RepID=UPI0005F55160|nr:PREDICTED: neurotensin receptor type 2 isoform X4 [Cercocebus atys]
METSSPPPPRSSPNLGLSLDARLGVDTRLWAKVLFTALYALIWALGAASNALSVHVVLKARAGRAGRLRYHVLSLALSGLLLLVVGVPVELYSFVWFHYPWVFGDLGCRGYYFVRELCAYATVLSVTGLSAERCLAVCQPLRARSLLTPRRTRRLVALLWAASLGLALPMALIMGQKHELETAGGEPEPASRVCTVLVSRTALQVFIQEPSWPCMSSAGCRTMPAGSCTATSLMTHGLRECEEDTKLRPHELTKVSSAETKTCTPFYDTVGEDERIHNLPFGNHCTPIISGSQTSKRIKVPGSLHRKSHVTDASSPGAISTLYTCAGNMSSCQTLPTAENLQQGVQLLRRTFGS